MSLPERLQNVSIEYLKDEESYEPTKINNISELEEQIGDICQSIYDILGTQQLEATYQRALQYELEKTGIKIHSEISINIKYIPK